MAVATARPEDGEPLLAFSSRTVDLTMAFGETASQEVRLVGKLAGAASLRVVTVNPPGPDVAILSAEADKPAGVRVSDVGRRVGYEAGQVTFATGVDDPKELTLLYSRKVPGNLTVDPTNPYLDLRAPEPGVVVRVTSSRKDFQLTRAEILDGPFSARVERAPSGGYAVHVTPAKSAGREGQGEPGPDSQRGFLGKLRLVSNDPAEPNKDLPLFALGPLPRR
jgi:hypothetical protein